LPNPITDARELPEVRIELDAVLVPHRKLLVRKAAVWTALCRGPRPDLVRVEEIQLALQFSTGEFTQVADKIPVDIVGMFFVLDEGPISEDLSDANLPERSISASVTAAIQ